MGLGGGLAVAGFFGEEIPSIDPHAHIGRDAQDAAHLIVSQGVRTVRLTRDRMRLNAGRFGQAGLATEALSRGEMLNDGRLGSIGHVAIISPLPIIATTDLSQAQRYSVATMPRMDDGASNHVGLRIKAARKERDLTQAELGGLIGLAQPTIAEMEAGKLNNWPQHAPKIMRALGKPRSYFEPDESAALVPDLPPRGAPMIAYVEVEVLPTFAGMGGGGTGEGDIVTALLPRRLVEDELHAKPTDLLIIDLRGDSMEPVFFHGDQVVIDKRDRNPVQPGPFALWDGDGYVVKNVERRAGRYRIFSANPLYSAYEALPEEVQIMGRPVWYARRL